MNKLGDFARRNTGRILIGLVLASNLLCAVLFIVNPTDYTSAFELGDVIGAATVRGMGILFLMWNVPYVVAFIDPRRYRVSLWEAIAMQTIGVVGETLILVSLPPEHQAVRQSVLRFVVFDLLGLLLLLIAGRLTRPESVG